MQTPREHLEQIADRIRIGNKNNKITGLGACVFAGGFSLGMEEGGITVAGHFELPDCSLGSQVSMQKYPVMVAALDTDYAHKGEDSTTWKSAIQYLKDNDAIPRVVYCNPPCAAFAKQGARGGMADNANMCYTRYCAYNLCMELQSDVWLWELVEGIYEDPEGRNFLNKMAEEARGLGYQVHYFLTTAAYHGGYQNRPRFHFMASKIGVIDFSAAFETDSQDHKGWKTLGECLDALERWIAVNGDPPNHLKDESSGGGSLLDIIPYCPPGSYLRDLPDEIMQKHYRPRNKDWDGYGRAGVTQVRARRERTSPVIIGGHTVIHPDHDRFLTIRENAAVMGFPYTWRFSHGSKGYQEVGKGLCTHTARFLGRSVHQTCQEYDRKLAIDAKSPGSQGPLLIPHPTDPLVTDWRAAVSVPSMPCTNEERKEWWRKKHPNIPDTMAVPGPKKRPGRPPGARTGSGGRGKRSDTPVIQGPKKVVFVGHKVSALNTLVEKLEFKTILVTLDQDTIREDLGKVGHADLLVVEPDAWSYAYITMAVGAALAQGTKVASIGTDRFPKLVEIVNASDDTKRSLAIAGLLGMSPNDILKKMMEGQDAQQMLLKLMMAG